MSVGERQMEWWRYGTVDGGIELESYSLLKYVGLAEILFFQNFKFQSDFFKVTNLLYTLTI